MPSFDLLVFIGRFQPVHSGHLAVIRAGLVASRHVLVLAGSANRPRNIRDPFTAEERAAQIRDCLAPAEQARVTVSPLQDVMYNDPIWIRNVQAAAFDCVAKAHPGVDPAALRIGLIGHSKDRSSYYLRLFPTWGSLDVANHQGVSATALRERYFGEAPAQGDAVFEQRLPAPVRNWLADFAKTDAYRELQAEHAFVTRYQAQFAALKYPPTFNTADAVVIQSGHVLLVRRGARPGLGQLALPGGFIKIDEVALEAAIRELREETRLKIPEPVLRGSMTATQTFDNPWRSTRGRTFTHAFRFDLRPDTELPKVKGGDDAKEAFWMPLARVRSEEMFEDHFDILQKMVGL
jgi:bifunctional NMN adenylyltransferase/nudix hydrolase